MPLVITSSVEMALLNLVRHVTVEMVPAMRKRLGVAIL
jgi:hypothetical protein